jgi:O-antigen/teichoic acid export membrane protein
MRGQMTVPEVVKPAADDSLRSHAAFGIRWGAIDQGAQFALRLGALIVLAHFVTPHDVGVMAIASIVLNLGSLAVGLGVSDALVQRRDLDRTTVDVAFAISTATGLLVAAVVVACSVPIADLFNAPEVTNVLIAVSVIFVVSGVERTPNDMLVRSMRFRDFYISSTIATFLSVVVAITIAVAGGGVWALAAMAITEAVVATALAWAFAIRAAVWRPAFDWDAGRARALLGFGSYVAGYRVIGYGRENVDNILVGTVLGTTSLGLYSFAYRAIIAPLTKVVTVLGTTAFSLFSALQHDVGKVREGMAYGTRYLTAVCFPLTAGIAISAPLLIPVLFGERWAGATRIIQILAGLGPYFALVTLDSSVLNALGKSSLQFRIGLVEFAVALVGILIGVQYSASGVAIGVVVAAYVVLPLKLYFRCRNLDATVAGQLLPAVPATLATLLMSAVTLGAREVLADRYSATTALVAVVAVGVASYGVALLIFAPSLLAQAWRHVLARTR